VITGPLQPTGKAVLSVLDPATFAGARWKAILPSPLALVALAENASGRRPDQVLDDAAAVLRAEAQALAAAGCAYLQFNDPVLVTRAGRDDMVRARDALGKVTSGLRVRTALHTFFGDAGPILNELLRFPVDEIGLDLYAGALNGTSARAGDKIVLVGVLDGRNSLLEDVGDLVEHAMQARDRLGAADVALVPNCDLEFLPWDVAAAKVRRLGEAAAALRRR
jgi:5-methyltetrahydropteroyltriglutamate--homocysteine methyltransferase